MSHDLGKKLLVSFVSEILREHFNACLDFLHKLLNILHLFGSVVVKEAGEPFDPAVNNLLQLFNERLRVNTKPADVCSGFHAHDAGLVFVETGDFRVKHFESGLFGDDTMENLCGHSIKVFDLKLAHLIFEIITGFKFSKESLAKGRTLVKESLERGLEILLPKERNVRVLVKEFGRG